MTELHPVEAHYRNRLKEAEGQDGQDDYLALDQGEYGTALRHAAVLDVVKGLDGNVLDLGCGTGMILDGIVARGLRPAYYLGMDGLADRRQPVLDRLQRYGIEGRFQHTPMAIRFEDVMMPYVDAVLFVGVMGYWGYHSQRHVRSIHDKLRRIGKHGCITFPMIYDANSMGDSYLRRWAVL